MSTLRSLKLSLLNASRASGVFHLVRNSGRRANQLLILCYHGISIDDEHEWAPGLYMSPEAFEGRLRLLRRGRYFVLPLREAVRRLYEGTLPPRSVAITFDDGNFDFHARAWPLLAAYDQPATVYLTTYYSENSLAVFPLAVSYVLWKARGIERSFPLAAGTRVVLDTRTAGGRRQAQNALLIHAQDTGMSALEKEELVGRIADALGVDYAAIARKRVLHLMKASEVRELSRAGVDFQLHTHRHRTPLDEGLFREEVESNRQRVAALTGGSPRHFCYPSGVYRPQFAPWLEAEGIASATTCEPGMATRRADPFRLPRLLDHSDMTALEFDAWLSGLGSLLPRRPVGRNEVDREGRLLLPRSSGIQILHEKLPVDTAGIVNHEGVTVEGAK